MTNFDESVLDVIRKIQADGAYPSIVAIAKRLPGHTNVRIWTARKLLVALGLVKGCDRASTNAAWRNQHNGGGLDRGLHWENDGEIRARQAVVRAAKAAKAARGLSDSLSLDELDQVLPPIECRRRSDRPARAPVEQHP